MANELISSWAVRLRFALAGAELAGGSAKQNIQRGHRAELCVPENGSAKLQPAVDGHV